MKYLKTAMCIKCDKCGVDSIFCNSLLKHSKKCNNNGKRRIKYSKYDDSIFSKMLSKSHIKEVLDNFEIEDFFCRF